MNKYKVQVIPELINAIRTEEIIERYNFPYTAVAEIEKLDTKEDYDSCFGMLIADEIAKLAMTYPVKPVCDLDSLLKIKGNKHVLFINYEDYEKVPDKLKPFTVSVNYIPEGTMLRVLGDLKSGVFKYGQVRVVTKEETPDNRTIILKYEFDISKYFIEYYCI